MLDLTLQGVCEVAMQARESHYLLCLMHVLGVGRFFGVSQMLRSFADVSLVHVLGLRFVFGFCKCFIDMHLGILACAHACVCVCARV